MKKPPGTKRVTVSMTDDALQWVTERAQYNGAPISTIVMMAIPREMERERAAKARKPEAAAE